MNKKPVYFDEYLTHYQKKTKRSPYTHCPPPLSPPTAATLFLSPRIFVCAAAILMLANPVMASLVSELSQTTYQQLCKWECWYLAKFRLMYYLGWQEKEIPSSSYIVIIFVLILFLSMLHHITVVTYTEVPPQRIHHSFHRNNVQI